MATPGHKSEQTGDSSLDRIQNNVRDLIAFVRSLEWLRRRAYVALATDVTTASATYANLISTTITSAMARSYLVIHFTASGVKSTNTGRLTFQVLVDGVVAKGAAVSAAAATSHVGVALVVRVPVTAGLHTVMAQWATTTASFGISAATAVDEHATMSVYEEAA